MKREGGTSILKHMVFESRIFQFKKTPNGRITMLDKDTQHTLLKGMSPDLFDNIIMLCGATCYDCYRMLRDESGMMKKAMEDGDMLAMLNVANTQGDYANDRILKPKRIRNASNILNIISRLT
jgi:hypothetical protein